MKKYLQIAFLFFSITCKAQIILEHSLDSVSMGNQFYCTDIGNNEFKYVLLDSLINGFHLYNMDFTPFMLNIIIPAPGDSIKDNFTVCYISRTLFDCDSTNIEYVYENQLDINRTFRVLRTDGTVLLQVDSANGPYCLGCYGGSHDIRPIQNTSDGTKLFLQKRNIQYYTGIQIYSVCGTLTNNIYDFSENKSFIKVFPNPTSMELNFEITLPNNMEEFQIIIFDAMNKQTRRENISVQQGRYSLSVREYNSGTYFYSLISKSKVYQTGKFSLIK